MSNRRLPALRNAAAVLAAALLAGCSTWFSSTDSILGLVSPYRIAIQQGNVITQEQLARVKLGMNRLQVRDILGTSLITDAFHVDRWDYVFTLSQSGRPLQRRNVVLTFNGDVLKNIEASELPTEREFIDSISRSGRMVAASELELSPEQLKSLPIPGRAPPSIQDVTTPAVSPRIYPPLEP
jgi:outer membrane protein assembly factor BamE